MQFKKIQNQYFSLNYGIVKYLNHALNVSINTRPKKNLLTEVTCFRKSVICGISRNLTALVWQPQKIRRLIDTNISFLIKQNR